MHRKARKIEEREPLYEGWRKFNETGKKCESNDFSSIMEGRVGTWG